MPKAERTHVAKTARATPYPYPNSEAADVTNVELIKDAPAVEGDSGYYSSTDNSYPDGPDEQAYLTHPQCYGNDHVEKLETFANDLDQALKSSFPPTPTADTYPYTGVFVLLLCWTDDDLQVHREITKLHNVFAAQFSFQVEQWQIPSINPTRALQTKLYDFQNSHQSEKELLIVYYGGHGEADPRRGRSLWRANVQPNSPSLNWSSLQHLLETAVPYVLIILDCCFAANAARDTAEGSTKEILAACGRENPTLGVCDRSFTAVLVEEMQAFGKTPFTVAMLHSRLVTMRWRLAFTPIYALLSEHGGNSIAISPVPQNPSPPTTELDDWKALSAELPANGAVELGGKSSIAKKLIASPISRSNSRDTRVLLSVSIAQEAELDLTHWTKWLATAAPWDILKVDVQIESVFTSHSTLVLVSIPISGWNLLAERPAYRFIGFIQSQNLLHKIVENGAEGTEELMEKLKSSYNDCEALNSPILSHSRSATSHANNERQQSGRTNLGRGEDSAPASDTEREQSHAASTRNEQSLRSKRATFFSGSGQSMNVDYATAESHSGVFDEVPRDAPQYSLEGKENAIPRSPAESAHEPAPKKSRKNPPWSNAEEQRLKTMREAGDTWGAIAKTFPIRTEASLKKHWYKDMHYADFAEDDSAALAVAIEDYKASMWKVIGEQVGKSAKACQQYAKEHLGGE